MMLDKTRKKGAVIVEFALSFLLFIILSVGLFEMARVMWAHTTLSFAVRQGARYALVRGANATVLTEADTAAVTNVVKNKAIGLFKDDITVEVTWESASKDGGEYVLVKATYPFTFFTGTAFISNDNLAVGAQSEMVMSY